MEVYYTSGILGILYLRYIGIQGVPKKMPHSELRLLGPYRAPLKLTLGLNTPIYDTRVCVGTKETLTLPYIVPYGNLWVDFQVT